MISEKQEEEEKPVFEENNTYKNTHRVILGILKSESINS